jgi:GR25 family glycosyltransferase involved in LPS biosynthesis
MNVLKSFLLFLFFIFSLVAIEGAYKIESVFSDYDGERKVYLLTLFLPYNPIIVSCTSDPKVRTACNFWWPKCHFYLDKDCPENSCDLLWIANSGNELDLLYKNEDRIRGTSVIFTTTDLLNYGIHFQNLKSFLEMSGFTLLGHWYWENEHGEAMFIKTDLFNAAMRTLNYSPSNFSVTFHPMENKIEQHLSQVRNKSPEHKIDNIDFIYMINLDERPEKFAQASTELSFYGIYPYRFSAVNGWKLSTDVLNQVGVKFRSDFGQEKFLGSIYREIDGQECLGNEIIRADGQTFFTLGMSHGAIGIILSHLSILQDADDSNYQTIWVMEDDVEAVGNPLQISELIPRLDALVPDWDILFTDTDTKDRAGNHVACRAIAARPNFSIPPLSSYLQYFYPVSEEFSRIGMRYGAYSMIVRRSGIKKILQHFKTYGIFIPYDMDIWLNQELKMYCVNKDIVSHRAGAPTDNGEPHYLKKRQ